MTNEKMRKRFTMHSIKFMAAILATSSLMGTAAPVFANEVPEAAIDQPVIEEVVAADDVMDVEAVTDEEAAEPEIDVEDAEDAAEAEDTEDATSDYEKRYQELLDAEEEAKCTYESRRKELMAAVQELDRLYCEKDTAQKAAKQAEADLEAAKQNHENAKAALEAIEADDSELSKEITSLVEKTNTNEEKKAALENQLNNCTDKFSIYHDKNIDLDAIFKEVVKMGNFQNNPQENFNNQNIIITYHGRNYKLNVTYAVMPIIDRGPYRYSRTTSFWFTDESGRQCTITKDDCKEISCVSTARGVLEKDIAEITKVIKADQQTLIEKKAALDGMINAAKDALDDAALKADEALQAKEDTAAKAEELLEDYKNMQASTQAFYDEVKGLNDNYLEARNARRVFEN